MKHRVGVSTHCVTGVADRAGLQVIQLSSSLLCPLLLKLLKLLNLLKLLKLLNLLISGVS